MRAVILATTVDDNVPGRPEPTSLRPVVDRPIIQHLVEQLVRNGASEIDVVESEAPERFRALLGEGRRWGIAIRHHLARDGRHPAAAVRRASRGAREPLVFAAGDCLVPADASCDTRTTTVFCLPADEVAPGAPFPQLRWSGLAYLPPRLVGALPDGLDTAQIGPWLIDQALERGAVRAVHARITTRTSRDWVAAQREALEGAVPGLILGGRESRPGVWLSRNARIHPEARIVAPAWIGEDVRVERGAAVGPGAVVGAGSIVDAGTRVEAALVTPGTYLGESMELKDAVADRGVVTHARIGAIVSMADPFLVGETRPQRGHAAAGLLGRLVAALVLVAAAPLVLLARLWRGACGEPGFEATGCARQPVRPGGPRVPTFRLWRLAPRAASDGPRPSPSDLVGRVLPGLWSVARGELRLVGVTPRDPDALAAIPEAWREACSGAPAGLVSEALVLLDADAAEEERAAADAWYAGTRSARRDAWLFARYLRDVVLAPVRSPRHTSVGRGIAGV